MACWEGAGTAGEGAGTASAGRQDDDNDDLLLETTAALRGPKTAAGQSDGLLVS